MSAYYHLCGTDSYLSFMRNMQFAYEVMLQVVGESVLEEELKDYEKIKQLNLLKGFEIRFNESESKTDKITIKQY
ncbi:hypothetical protein PP175_28240 (plasmid) [Aneurinibacillus sp. Ricciae_BoGa-3]|uniref:hypothetical protein n=1 Tax=Aneurinibacillus sp. Ricciae_BoGa-3 TaxID=3022697 RepID=UPI002340C5C6|nr:hypothetical protein [Aneurinibacillus sp. Ricciae_BoGa-3]WCK57081.1 hypothetical protein PP175_28240 [Aneurinibacillus sp. Ricciae_BoGa-3]